MHCIWDFNGTLLADAQLALEADNRLLAQMGKEPITMETYRTYMRNPLPGFYRDIGCDLDAYSYAWINRAFLDYFNPRLAQVGLIPGTKEMLARLSNEGDTHSILSSSHEPVLLEQARALGVDEGMQAITGMPNDNGDSKEERGVHQLSLLGIPKTEAVLIGDMTTDAFVAEHMGIRCVLVTWGHNTRARLERCNVPVVDTHEELEKCLANMRTAR